MTLCDKLVKLRKRKNLSQMDVAEQLDVSRQAVSRWEAGTSKPSTDNIRLLCKIYDVTIDYLLDESEDEPPEIVPIGPSVESRPVREILEKKNLWIKWLVISFIAFALLVSGYYLYENSHQESFVNLHEIQKQEDVLDENSKFNLNWE